MNLKTILTYAAIAFAIWWVVQQPANAAHLIHNIAGLPYQPGQRSLEFRLLHMR